jgi:hypothetical protein
MRSLLLRPRQRRRAFHDVVGFVCAGMLLVHLGGSSADRMLNDLLHTE